jgi:hypothetical protein
VLTTDVNQSTYSVVVTREESPPAPELTGLTISGGALDPAFDGATKNYSVTVPYETTSVTVTATAAAPGSTTIVVAGVVVPSGQASPPQTLYEGDNGITTLVFADGAVSKYVILVTRQRDTSSSEISVIRDEDDSTIVTGILNLPVDGLLYDVQFSFGAGPDFYGDAPGEYTFTDEASSTLAVDAVNSVLNALGDVTGVGIGSILYHVPFEYWEPAIASLKARVGKLQTGVWNQLSDTTGDVIWLDESTSYAVFTEIGVASDVVPTLTITQSAPGEITLSWTPDTNGFVLQDSPDMEPDNWTNTPNGSENPLTLTIEGDKYFFRLIQP